MALLLPPADPPLDLELLHLHAPDSSASAALHRRTSAMSHRRVSCCNAPTQWPCIRPSLSERRSFPCKCIPRPGFSLHACGGSGGRSTGNNHADAMSSQHARSAAGRRPKLLRERIRSPSYACGGDDDGGSNSGQGGNGGHGGLGKLTGFGPEDQSHSTSCYGLAIIMMDLQGLCNDIISDSEFSEHSSLFDNLKAVLNSLVSCLLSFRRANSDPLSKYVSVDDGSNASVAMIDHRNEDEAEMKETIPQEDGGYANHYGDEVVVHGDYRENNVDLQKIEHGQYGFQMQEHADNDKLCEGLLSKSAVISWFSHHALAKVADDQATLAEAENTNMKERKTKTEELTGDSPPQLEGTGGDFIAAKKSDLEIMKRLQREVFLELMKIRERLDKMEQARCPSDRQGRAKTQLKGEAKAGVALVLLDDARSSQQSRDALVNAGMQSGLDTSFTFETRFRERDSLIIQCVSGQGSSVGDGRALGGPLALGKLQYVTHLGDDFSLSFVPLGAQGKDVTEIINVHQEKGFTSFSSHGPALFNYCRGSALGATVSGSMFAFSLGQYLSGWGNQTSSTGRVGTDSSDPLCLSTLGQLLMQPIEGFVVSLSGLGQYWPSPPLPSSMGLHWSEMGPLVIPKLCSWKKRQSRIDYTDPFNGSVSHSSSSRSHLESPKLEYGADSLECKGTSSFSFALASSMDLSENASISAWAQIEKGDSLQDVDSGNLQWAVNLSKVSESGIEWGASIGCRRLSPFCWDSNSYNSQLQVEAFLRIECAKGFTLQPGFLYISSQSTQTPAFIIKSNWSL